jgi:hypothetical protein
MSAGQIVGGIIGAVVGWFIGGPAGAVKGFMIGASIGAYVTQPDQVGPRLDDLKTQMSTYGAPIPFEWGCNRHAGTIIWPRILNAVEHQHSESAKGGPDVVTYTYTMSLAVLVCEGPITGIRRIWANKKIVYDVRVDGSVEIYDPVIGTMRVHLGTEDQDVDPLIEASDGVSPAYRGYAYVVFENYDVTELQGRPPQWEFEVIQSGETDFSPELTLLDLIPEGTRGAKGYQSGYDPVLGNLWVHNGGKASLAAGTGGENDRSCINVYNITTRTRSAIISPGEYRDFGDLVYDPDRLCVFAAGEYIDTLGGDELIGASVFDAATFEMGDDILRSSHLPGMSWPQRPGTLVGLGASTYLAATSSSHVGSGICLWTPESGVYAVTGETYLLWKNQALLCSDNRVAMLADGVSGGGLIMMSPYLAFDYVLYPDADFGGVTLDYVCEDVSRERLIVCAGAETFLFDLATDVISSYFDNGYSALCAIHDDRSDLSYIITRTSSLSWRLSIVNPESLEVINTFDLDAMEDEPTEMFLSPVSGEVVVVGESSVWLLSGLFTALEPEQVALSTIVSDICLRAGLTAGDIDVTELASDSVDGFVIGRQMTARAAIEPLQMAYQFDAVESDDKIKFVKRAGGTVTTIPMDKRAAHEAGSDIPEALSITRAFELELPYQCDIDYADIDADHLIGTQYERRITKSSKQKLTIALPIVMTAEKAKQIARILLYESWQQMSFSWSTGREFAYLEPTDIVSLPTAAATYQARVTTKRELPNGVIEWEGALVAMEAYDQTGSGAAPTNYVSQTIYNPGTTLLKLLDIPMLRDDDDNAGFYVAMGGESEGWRGAQLYRSSDGGTNYDPLFGMTNPATIGRALDVLPDFTSGNIFDEGSTVDVLMLTGIELTSVTQDQVLNGYNKAVIGAHGRWEVIHFKNADLIDTDTYRLSGFLRGCRGTEWATGTHVVGDSFVLASVTAWNRLNAGDTGLPRMYKAPPMRIRLSDVVATAFTNSSVALKPFAPVNMVGARDVSNNLTLTWDRRTRLAAGTLHLAVLLGEASESYSIDIMDGDDVVRTITSATPTATYLASEQTADGLTPGDPVTARVYQISAAVGRGYHLEATV